MIYKAQVIAANTYANTCRPQTPRIVGRDGAGARHRHGGGGDLGPGFRGVGHPSAAGRHQPPHPLFYPSRKNFSYPETPLAYPLPATIPQKQGWARNPIRYLSATGLIPPIKPVSGNGGEYVPDVPDVPPTAPYRHPTSHTKEHTQFHPQNAPYTPSRGSNDGL